MRALWPQLQDQHRFNAAALDALTSLERLVEDLETRLARLEGRASLDTKIVERSRKAR